MTPNKIIRSKRKTISITINEDAELVVRAPKKLSIEKIQDFINEKEKWINKKKKLIEDQMKDASLNQDKLLYLGSLFPITLNQSSSKKFVFVDEGFIISQIQSGGFVLF